MAAVRGQRLELSMVLLQHKGTAASLALAAITLSRVLTAGSAFAAGGMGVCLLRLRRTSALSHGLRVDLLRNSLVIMPLDKWSSITKKGLSLAVQLRGEVQILHVDTDNTGTQFESLWQSNVVAPLLEAERTVPELVMLASPHGQILQPIADYILQTERREPDRQIIVVVPRLEVRHWWQRPLHNHRSRLLKLILSIFGSARIMIIDVPWHL